MEWAFHKVGFTANLRYETASLHIKTWKVCWHSSILSKIWPVLHMLIIHWLFVLKAASSEYFSSYYFFLRTGGLFDGIVYHFSPKAYCIVSGLLSLKTCFAVFSCPYRQMSLDALAGTSVYIKQKWGTRRRTGLNSTIWWQYCHCDGTTLTFCLYSCFLIE